MTRCGSAAALCAALWLDYNLAPSETLDAPPQVLESVLRTVHHRHTARTRAVEARAEREDMQAGVLMHGIVDRIKQRGG